MAIKIDGLSNSATDLINDIEKDLDRFANNYCEAFSKLATQRLYEKAKECINYFYDNYKPKKYKRTNNLRDNSIVKTRPIFDEGKSGTGGIRISSEKMKRYPEETYFFYDRSKYSFEQLINDENSSDALNEVIRTTDPAVVANAAWIYGMHGVNYSAPKQTDNPTPLKKLIQETVENDEFNEKLMDEAYGVASRKHGYKILKWR